MPEQTIGRLVSIGRAGWASLPPATPVPGLSIPGGAKSILVLRASGCVLLADDGKPITRTTEVTFTRADRIDRGRFRQHVAVHETSVPYMYLDTVGKVTVGLGHLIENAAAAKQLPFVTRKAPGPGRPPHPAHPAHIANAFNRVLNSGRTGAHTKFRDLTHIELSPIAIETLFGDDFATFVSQLNSAFPEFETYPAGVQLGMLDLVYNMGKGRFVRLFTQFQAALELRNWIRVADESKRTEVDIKNNPVPMTVLRNQVVRGWFLEAIDDEPFFLNPACLPRRLSTIQG